MLRTASIGLNVTAEQHRALSALRMVYANACNRLVPLVIEHRCWNRVDLHRLGYARVRVETNLGSQMACNAIYSVCKAYKAQSALGRVSRTEPVRQIRFDQGSVHFDKRTYRVVDNKVSLYTLEGRIVVGMRLGTHQRRVLSSGAAKEAELVLRNGRWFFNLIVESESPPAVTAGPTVGVDIGENTLAAISTGKVFGGECLRHWRDGHLALRRRLQSNGSRSAKQKLRQVSGRERRRVRHINHESSKAIVAAAVECGAARIVLEDLTHIRSHIRAGRRTRTRLHRWAFRQLQSFIEYKARASGVEIVYANPAYSSRTCSCCGCLGVRVKHRFECHQCGLRSHADLNASRNLARIGGTAVLPRAIVNTPDVGNVCREVHVLR